jgi:tRNA acetyltransferase TAN1
LIEGVISPGETGVWVSCARGQEGKAAREVVAMFDEVTYFLLQLFPLLSRRGYEGSAQDAASLLTAKQYAEILYGVKPQGEEPAADDEEEEDIEASIRRELDAMKATGKEAKLAGRIFTPVKMNVACLLFVRTRSPVEPVAFVKRICQDAKSGEQRTRSRYVNRLVPMTAVGRATEQGLVELAKKVLGELFDLSGKRTGDDAAAAGTKEEEKIAESGGHPPCSVRGEPYV